jgi:hypothetical protein
MGETSKMLISLAVAFVGSFMTGTTIIKSMAVFLMHRAQSTGPLDFTPHWYSYIVPAAMVGSLVLGPILAILCYRALSRKK